MPVSRREARRIAERKERWNRQMQEATQAVEAEKRAKEARAQANRSLYVVDTIRRLTSSWLDAMIAAGSPGAIPLYVKRDRLIPLQKPTEKSAGWMYASSSPDRGTTGYESDTAGSGVKYFVLVDGRLASSYADVHQSPNVGAEPWDLATASPKANEFALESLQASLGSIATAHGVKFIG